MSHFKYHVFFCTNQRAPGEMCCTSHGAQAMRDYCKNKVKAMGDRIAGKVRINSAGCLARCAQGPVIVVYPEAVWYTYVDQEDIDEIVESHLAQGLISNNPVVDHVYNFDSESILILQQMKFDFVMNVDKSQQSCALLNSKVSNSKLGFGLNPDRKIIPVNNGAYHNFSLGMDDHFKFKVNQRTGQDYLAETFELDYNRDEYVFELTDEEIKFVSDYKKKVGIKKSDKVSGFNTGSSELYPNKKMTIDQHIYLIVNY